MVMNVAKYIEVTIDSIQAQTFKDWELIIMDGASKDGTQAIVERYAKDDPRIRLKSEPDEGPWDATEKAMAMAEGEYIMIVSGNDGFLDNTWFQTCMDIFDRDKTVSLVWASTRGMHDDGTLAPASDLSYSHLTQQETTSEFAGNIVKKIGMTIHDLVFGSPARRKTLWKKLTSKTAVLKMNFYFRRDFPQGFPEKEEWFRYWLDTALPFSEQPMCLPKHVYLNCVRKYPKGSRKIMDHIMDLHYNFNAKGYLSYYVPRLAGWGRDHPGKSGDRIPEVLQRETDHYMQKVLELRKRYVEDHEEMVFIDRDGHEVSRRIF